MSRLFMYGTSLEGIEKLMMAAPNFSPRDSGIIIQNYFNCDGGVVNCNNCGSNARNRSYISTCFYLKEKLNGNEIKYKDLVKDCFGRLKNNTLRIRLRLLSNNFKGEVFLNHSHKKRCYHLLQKQDMDIRDTSPSYISILFLLTADEVLWKLSEPTVRANGFDFSQIHLRQISTEGYALYQTAKTISTGKEHIRISEIADEDLINDIAFKAIINASLIARYGADIFLITK
ncbi:hypothetical protein SAMN00017405_0831 [Desulfonispora thiosulfatigenes DSM 11270]|uniref:Uncharacterized protein n=1 Tax=Desulfonispora thiosulfatigenes DSM 11270 TaxID=656914 RepID=A0A1W1UG19_DESTI|nr:hypothetical protein [Desulfonispora thiosulfatigenes]SMB80058.1 hypothetical protein SAMN00017405_0831 [Desulfonispora thiosulfatigenes DSM 11270]